VWKQIHVVSVWYNISVDLLLELDNVLVGQPQLEIAHHAPEIVVRHFAKGLRVRPLELESEVF
jgi:hypothetical protein